MKNSLQQRDAKTIWHPYSQANDSMPPLAIRSAKGSKLITEEGVEIIDAISSWWVNIHGHCHPYITEKVSLQLATLEHVLFAGFTHQPAVELAERLLRILPGNCSRIFYSDNGSTAVEVALKMGLQYWYNRGQKRDKIVALTHGYHGDTFGAMAASARGLFTAPFEHLLFNVIHVDLEDLDTISKVMAAGDVAAFIFEPLVQGAGGMRMHDPKSLDATLSICKAHEVITIADEVMTGFGRTGLGEAGQLFASAKLKIKPDLFCLSKALTSGTVPLSATACPEWLYKEFLHSEGSKDRAPKTFFHGHSFTANPVGCAAALASLDLLQTEKCRAQILQIGELHHEFLGKISGLAAVKNPRQCGTILAFEVESAEGNSYTNPLKEKLYCAFLEKGVLLRPLGNTVYIMPPYAITKRELEQVYDAIIVTLERL